MLELAITGGIALLHVALGAGGVAGLYKALELSPVAGITFAAGYLLAALVLDAVLMTAVAGSAGVGIVGVAPVALLGGLVGAGAVAIVFEPEPRSEDANPNIGDLEL